MPQNCLSVDTLTPFPALLQAPVLPSYLSITQNIDCPVVICAEHGTSFVKSRIDDHLRRKHRVPSKHRRAILQELSRNGVVNTQDQAFRPPDGGKPLSGLPVLDGFVCTVDPMECRTLTISEPIIRRHCRIVHGIGSYVKTDAQILRKRGSLEPIGYRSSKLQTLFSFTTDVDYFAVAWSSNPEINSTTFASSSTAREGVRIDIPELRDQDSKQYDQDLLILERNRRDANSVGEVQHVSEQSVWLRHTTYHQYLDGLDFSEFAKAYTPPRADEHTELGMICESVKRLFLEGSAYLDRGQLLTQLAFELNTCRTNVPPRKPLQSLQNEKSRLDYAMVAQKLVCFYARVVQKEALTSRSMFTPTSDQIRCWGNLKMAAFDALENKYGEFGYKDREEADRRDLDGFTVQFIISLITQPIVDRIFESPVHAFIPVVSWLVKQQTFIKVGQYTSLLAKLTYIFRLFSLIRCNKSIPENDEERHKKFGVELLSFRDKWMLSNTYSPVGHILVNRPLFNKIAEQEVAGVNLRWTDGQTLVYRDIRLTVPEIRSLIRYQLERAKTVLQHDLFLGFEDIPAYNLKDIEENWEDDENGASFVNNPKNDHVFEDHRRWIFDHIRDSPEHGIAMLSRDQSGALRLKSNVVDMYEHAVQRFLEHVAILLHVGSGQPARRTELLSLRWRNRDKAKRNLFVNRGHLVFVVSYHKSQSMSNGSRFPARVVLPEVARMLVQYLVCVMPFRSIMLAARQVSPSDYLWAEYKSPWSPDRFTRVFKSAFELAVGSGVTLQAWRHIAIAIAMRYLGGKCDNTKKADESSDEEDGGHDNIADDDNELEVEGNSEAILSRIFHLQASHSEESANRNYASLYDFRNGLTDQGLRQFFLASKKWHKLVTESDSTPCFNILKKRKRSKTDVVGMPLLKRLSFKNHIQRYRKCWSMEEAQSALESIYGPQAKYTSRWQEEAVYTMITGATPITVILGTGHGKSLLYMLPRYLPGAGSTVVVVPLTALKQDTLRRCKAQGLSTVVWEQSMGGKMKHDIILVSVEKAVTPDFKSDLEILRSDNGLHSIVVDECHLVLSAADYRPKMKKLWELQSFGCQMIYLTATLPRYMMESFFDASKLRNSAVVRGPVMRADIQYEVQRNPGRSTSADVVSFLKEQLRKSPFKEESEARALVYCLSRSDVDVIADALGCAKYYSDSGSEQEKALTFKSWVEGSQRVMICTGAFGAGVDYASARLVVHVGLPRSALDFVQEVGRGGRDGKGCRSVVIVPKKDGSNMEISEEFMSLEARTMHRYVGRVRCRQRILGEFLDGSLYTCENEGTACDLCRQLGLLDPSKVSTRNGSTMLKDSQRKDPHATVDLRRVDLTIGDVRENGIEFYQPEDRVEVARAIKTVRSEIAGDKEDFLSHLELARGNCAICLLKYGVEKAKGHVVDQCTDHGKREFFDMKKALNRAGQQWMAPYSGCYQCGLSQTMCSVRSKGEKCLYKDIVMPISFLVYKESKWVVALGQMVKPGLRDLSTWLNWLGSIETVFNDQSNNMVLVTSGVLRKIYSEGFVIEDECRKTVARY